jgi:hypothetical protein
MVARVTAVQNMIWTVHLAVASWTAPCRFSKRLAGARYHRPEKVTAHRQRLFHQPPCLMANAKARSSSLAARTTNRIIDGMDRGRERSGDEVLNRGGCNVSHGVLPGTPLRPRFLQPSIIPRKWIRFKKQLTPLTMGRTTP